MTQHHHHNEEPKRAALYARNSQLNPPDGMEPLQAQVDRCTAFCLEQEYLVFSDQGYAQAQVGSAGSNRPALARLYDAVRQGRANVVVVSSPDRLARCPAQGAIFGEEFKAARVTIAGAEA